MNGEETRSAKAREPGNCIPWEDVRSRYGEIQGDEEQIERTWRETDAEAYDYFWQCLLSF